MTPVLSRIWKALAVLVVVIAALLGLWVFHTLPMYDGKLQLEGIRQSTTIQRDAADVVHISASNQHDAAFALGFVHAQERSWQMEFNRRLMHGELAEILGEAALPTDKLMRTLGLIQAAQRQLDRLPQDVREHLNAYSAGVQAFHAKRPQGLPPEFTLLRTQPGGRSQKAWQPVDSVAWSLVMALDLGGNWGHEFARLAAARRVNTSELWDLYPHYPDETSATQVDLAKLYRDLGVYKQETLATTSFSLPMLGEPGYNEGRGSNNWVLAGSHTTTGKPLLANDPHLALSAPAIWFYAHLQTPDSNVIGATLPGLPFVVLGHNTQVAWGFTNTGPDVQDLYLEQIDPRDPKRYKTPTGWQSFETRTETIAVKGQADVTHVVRHTRHGPVISDAQAVHAEVLDVSKFVLALRWSALDADNRTLVSGWKAQQAKNVSELMAAYADNHSPTQNIVMADTQGHIAFKVAGRVPVRHPHNDIRGVAPAPGWDARYDWVGWIDYQDMPSDDGSKGWVATANQRITTPNAKHFLGQDWNTMHRFDRIIEVLQSKPKHDLQDMQALQNDTLSLSTRKLLPVLQDTPSQHPLASQAQDILAHFTGQMTANASAPLIFAAWADELTRGLVEPKLGRDLFKAQYGKRHFRQLLEKVMSEKTNRWCAPKTCTEQSTEALDRALNKLAAQHGNTPSRWRWGDAHLALSTHKPLGQVPVIRDLFNVKTPSDGDLFTVNVGQYWAGEKYLPFANRHAASLRVVYDLADLERSQFIYQTGQSGLVWSSNYNDMKTQWANGGYRPLRTRPDTWAHTLELTP